MMDAILNRYEIKDVLGRNAIGGVIYSAFDSRYGRDAVLKTESHVYGASILRNEWQILKRLHHKNVIDAYDFGELQIVDYPHPPAAQLLDDAIMRDGLVDHRRESYVGETGKSMKRS